MTDTQQRDQILRDIRVAEAKRDYAKCAALMRELVPVTRRIRDAMEYDAHDVRHDLAMMIVQP